LAAAPLIETRLSGDTFFPEYSRADWEETAREAHGADADNPYPYTFLELARRAGRPAWGARRMGSKGTMTNGLCRRAC
jgi:hypothetical protein